LVGMVARSVSKSKKGREASFPVYRLFLALEQGAWNRKVPSRILCNIMGVRVSLKWI
jgi:hypothetical protein